MANFACPVYFRKSCLALVFPSSHLLCRLYYSSYEPLSPSQSLLATSRVLDRARKRERGRGRKRRTLASGGGCQGGCRSEIETLPACARERVYMESSSVPNTYGNCFASWARRVRFRLLQYLSCCKFDVLLITRGLEEEEEEEENNTRKKKRRLTSARVFPSRNDRVRISFSSCGVSLINT